jgi:acyl-CoA synthetase (NDP forming)
MSDLPSAFLRRETHGVVESARVQGEPLTVESTTRSVRQQIERAVHEAQHARSNVLPERAGKAILRAAGIAVPTGVSVTRVEDVPTELIAPFALKAISPTLVHKSDVGGVRVGLDRDDLADGAEVMRAHLTAAGHACEAFLVEEMAPAGEEVVVGAVRTPGVGWAVMVGLGGVLVEVLQDVAFGVAPLKPAQIHDMLSELRGAPILEGVRGRPRLDIDALVELISRLAGPAGLLHHLPPDIAEVDLNPVIVSSTGAVAVDARFVISREIALPAHSGGRAEQARVNTSHSFDRLYCPEVIAVLGASAKVGNGGNFFIRNLMDFGFSGKILPIHPSAQSIEGIAATASLGALTEPVDYAYVALPAARVTEALAEGAGIVRFAQVVSSGFSETEDGLELERSLVASMRNLGTRVIGPNCLGTHSSRGGLAFVPEAPKEQGGVAVISQSGGLSVDILRLGESSGLAFHSVTSIGNSSDVSAAELLEYHLDLDQTTVIGLYLESLAAGREVLDLLAARPTSKPVVLLAGGQTADGSRAATSHTGALSGNHRLWPAIARQAGIELVDSLRDFISVLIAMELVEKGDIDGKDVVLFGNGGGASVLAADELQRNGLRTPPLPPATIQQLELLGLPPGNGLSNPIDVPAPTLAVDGGAVAKEILTVAIAAARPATVISHLNVGIIQRSLAATHGDVTGTLIEAIAEVRDAAPCRSDHLVVLKSDGKADTEAQIRDYAERARALGFPVYWELEEAAVAAGALMRQRSRRSPATPSTSQRHVDAQTRKQQ